MIAQEAVHASGATTANGALRVVRHDKVEGGTKRLALERLLKPGREYVYASPTWGYAQAAIAAACRSVGAQARIFVPERKERSVPTLIALRHGASVNTVCPGYMSVLQARAREHCERNLFSEHERVLLPFGLDWPAFNDELLRVALDVREVVGAVPEVWCVAGSGTLTRTLQRAWPQARHYAVQVGHKLTPHEAGAAKVLYAPERFEQRAKEPPPFPSAPNYDAKAWRFVHDRAQEGALFWNVAG